MCFTLRHGIFVLPSTMSLRWRAHRSNLRALRLPSLSILVFSQMTKNGSTNSRVFSRGTHFFALFFTLAEISPLLCYSCKKHPVLVLSLPRHKSGTTYSFRSRKWTLLQARIIEAMQARMARSGVGDVKAKA